MRRSLLPVVLAAGTTLVCTAPATADSIVAVRPSTVSIGDRVTVRADTPVRAGQRVSVDLSRRRGPRVRVAGTRLRPRAVRIDVPDGVAPLLRVVGGAARPTRFRVRLVVGGRAGPWTGGKRRLLVTPPPGDADSPGEQPGTSTPGESTTTRLLTAADLRYVGTFAMPEQACGWPTAWSTTGLALRRVDGRLRFFAGVHVYGGGLVYEAGFPGLSTDPASWPQAEVVADWCDIYQGRKRTGDGPEPLSGDTQTEGLLFDAADQRLYWSYGEFYNGDASNDNVLGYTTFDGDVSAHGPWRTTGRVHSQKVRGGTLQIPRRFADAYLGGRRLGLGFGGYYCIVGEGSMGPTLVAVAPPGDGDGPMDPVVLMDHPAPVAGAGNWAVRPATYTIDPGIDWAVDPSEGVGRWAPGDTVGAAAVWIDEPDVQGLLVAAQLQQGRIWYGGGALHSDGDASYWYVYDPDALAEVAQGRRTPESVQPSEIVERRYPVTQSLSTGDWTMTQRVAGMAYDSPSRTLFLLQLNARSSGGDLTPVVHAFRLDGDGGEVVQTSISGSLRAR